MINTIEINEDMVQVLLTGVFSDGCIYSTGNEYAYSTNCIHREYIELKYKILSPLIKSEIRSRENTGKSSKVIHTFNTIAHPFITQIAHDSLEDNLSRLNEFGLALWFYDDASLKKNCDWYNLYTNSFTESEHDNILIPYFTSLGLRPTKRYDVKEDKYFCYLAFNKFDGTEAIMKLLNKYTVDCFKYKTIPESEITNKFYGRRSYSSFNKTPITSIKIAEHEHSF